MQGSREVFVDSLDKLEEAFLKDAPKKGEYVVVIASDLFVQEVHLPAFRLRGLSEDEVRCALHYEVEPFSGFALDKVEVAYSVCDASFWVAEVGKDRLEVIRGLFARCGCSGAISPFVRDVNYKKLPLFKLVSRSKISVLRWSILGILLFVSLLLADYIFLFVKCERIRPGFEKLSVELERNRSILAELDGVGSRIKELNREREERLLEHRRIEGERDSTLVLLQAIGEAFADRAVLEKIEGGEIYAVAPSAKEAIEAWEIVARKVMGSGLRVYAPKLTINDDFMAHFTLHFEEVK